MSDVLIPNLFQNKNQSNSNQSNQTLNKPPSSSSTELDERTIKILEVKRLVAERDEIKKNSNYTKSDILREKLLKEYNVEVIDQVNGPSGWKFKDGSNKKLPNGIIIPDEYKVKRKRDTDVDEDVNKPNKIKKDNKSNNNEKDTKVSSKPKPKDSVEVDRNKQLMQSVIKPSQSNKSIQGVVIEELMLGSGTTAKSGNRIKVHYIGKLTNGKTFDACTKKPFQFRLGKGEVIRGWDIGCEGMAIGGKRKLTIPPEKGYGKSGAPPTIPGNATLVFEVTLIDIM